MHRIRLVFMSLALFGLSSCSVTLNPNHPKVFPAVTFTIDDGDEANWAVLFSSKGIVGTAFVITGKAYLTPQHWKSLVALQSAGWEIGGHTRTHPHLSTVDPATLEDEIGGCKQDLIANGIINPTSFAYPFGEYNDDVRTVARKYFRASRRGRGGLNSQPFVLDILNAVDGDGSALDELKHHVDNAEQNKQWMVVVLHYYRTGHPEDVPKAQKISALIDYIQAKSIPILTVSQVIDRTDPQ